MSAAIVAAFGPLAVVHAQDGATGPDDATAAAIASWRVATLQIVAPQYHDIIAATYAGQPVAVDPQVFDEAMIAKAQAEQAAYTHLDPASVALIRDYYSNVAFDGPDSL